MENREPRRLSERKRPAPLLLSLLLALASLGPSFVMAEDVEGFPVATPESQGIDSNRLREMSEWVRAEDLDVRSLLLLRRGHLVLEWYAGNVSRDSNHNIYSITKSVVSLLAGLAIDEGKMPSAETTLRELLPAAKGKPTEAITLAQLLSMRSGLPVSRGNEPEGPERELFERINTADDRAALILEELNLVTEPGKTFAYNNVDPQLVGSAIAAATGKPLPKFAEDTLFEPLGFQNADWMFADATGQVPGGYGLRLRALDLAKLGQLVLQGGKADRDQVISNDWIGVSTRDQTGTGYGYYWWLDTKNKIISAKGVRGQRLEIMPARDLVFVVTAELPPARVASITRALLHDYVLSAVSSPADPLPENPEALRQLRAELDLAAQHRPASRDPLPKFRLPQ